MWAIGRDLQKIKDNQLYREIKDEHGQQKYRTFRQYHLDREGLNLSAPTVCRLLNAIKAISGLKNEQQWMECEPWRVYALMKMIPRAPDVALAVAKGRGRIELADADPEGYHDPGYRKFQAEMSIPEYNTFQEAIRMVVFYMNEPYPDIGRVLENLAREFLQTPRNLPRWLEDDIFMGNVKCHDCGSHRFADLGRHHVVLRSHGGEDVMGVEQREYFCTKCHERIHREGTWRMLADEIGVGVPRESSYEDLVA